jgi:hypothetical protein
MRGTWLAMAAVVWGAGPLVGQEHEHRGHEPAKPVSLTDSSDGDRTPLYDNLGSYHKTITTGSPIAQKYFDQGLRLTYGFNHDEAIKSFREGIREDSTCAMCWWGVAYALGPNINLPMDTAAVAPAWEAVQQAVRNAGWTTAKEQAYIGALVKRYSPDPRRTSGPW